MTEPMLIVFGILAGAIVLWSWGRPRADIVAVQALHVSPEAFAMTVSISCSASFVTPVSSTWNLLVMEPGGYAFGDYVKVGLPLLFLTMLISVTLVRLIYRF